MGRLLTIAVVLCLLCAPVALLENNILEDNSSVENTKQNTPCKNSPSALSNPSPPIALSLPSKIKIWEAWAKGYATIKQTTGGTYTVTNNGPASVIIDEYAMLMNPSPANLSEYGLGGDETTQDGVLIKTYTISPGSSLVYNYGHYVAQGDPPPPWWCTEDTESTNAGIEITLGGEILPYSLWSVVKICNENTQGYYWWLMPNPNASVWGYFRNNPSLVIGKTPLWKEIANIGDKVDITLEVTNIGFLDAKDVVVTDTIPSGYSYDPSGFTKTPSSITDNPDGSITLKWDIAKIDGAVETPSQNPTDYTTKYMGYKLITPELYPDTRIFLPRAYVDKNNDGKNDAESEKPLLETYFVNRAPVAIVSDVEIFEGETAYLDGTSSYDPDELYGDSIVSYEWDFDGDGITDKYGSTTSWTYGDNGIYTATLTVTDSYGISSSITADITVYNVAPTINPLSDITIDEGGAATFNAYATDPGSDDLTFTWEFELGSTIANVYYNDGAGPDPYPSPGGTYPFSASDTAGQTYGDNGIYTITLTVEDDDGGSTTIMANVTVNNVVPTIEPFGPFTINEGALLNLSAIASDPGSDDLTFTWEFELGPTITNIYYNDGASPDPYPSPGGTYPFSVADTVGHTYGDNGVYTVTLTLGDDDGLSATYTTNITVNNLAPTGGINGIYSGEEGSPITFTATATDPGSDDLTFTWEFELGPTITNVYYNDGVGQDPYPSPGGTFPFSATDTVEHTYGDDATYLVSLTITDDDGDYVIYTTTVSVDNVAPTIEPFGPFTVDEGSSLTLQATSTDPGSDDLTFTWKFELGPTFTNIYYNDGVGEDPDPSPWGTFPFSATDTVEHTYGDNGVYSITMIVEDDDNGITTYTTNITVNNVAPTTELAIPITIYEGMPFTIISTASDPGSDDLQFTLEFELGPTTTNIYYNDGSGPDPYPSPNGTFPFSATDSAEHTYGDNGEYTLKLTVEDDDGGITTYTTNITVNNVAPTIEPLGPCTTDEGLSLSLTTTSTDPGSDDLTFTWEFEFGPTIVYVYYNDGIGPDPYPSPWGNYPFNATDMVEHTYGDNGEFNVTLTVTDDDGDSDVCMTTVTVHNVAPTTDLAVPITVCEGMPFTIITIATDPGSDDLLFTCEFELGPTTTNIYYNDGSSPDPYPSPWGTYPFTATEIGEHTYGDNGVYTITVTVEDDDGGSNIHTTNLTVNNLAPTIEPFGPFIVDEGLPLNLTATSTDPGSDDLTFTWEFELGPTTTNIHYNDGVGPDPYPSPEINPMSITEPQTHTYGDNGVFTITLTVEDDDGGITIATTNVTVINVAPTILNIEAFMYVNLSLRIAGEKWHSVGIHLFENGSEICAAKVTRRPGNPDEQRATITHVRIDMTKSYTALVDYLPNDPRVNGNVWGGNPVWIDMTFEDGSVKRLHHTFNVRQSYWESDHWNHIDPWEVELAPYIWGHNITLEATASDQGSDDLIFNWDFGDGSSAVTNTYYNNMLSPDPYPSPEINPISCTDVVTYTYAGCGVYCVTLTVEDDDGGICVKTLTLTAG